MATYENPGGRAGHSINEAQRGDRKRLKKEQKRKRKRTEVTEIHEKQVPEIPVGTPSNEKIIVELLPAGPKVTIIPLGGRKFDSGRRE